MALRLEAISLRVADLAGTAAFWADLLGRPALPRTDGLLVPGDERQVGLRFLDSPGPRSGGDWLHLHLTSDDLEDQQRLVSHALELGGSHLDVGQLADEGHVVLADPGGDELCVIEPGNRFLAGCGPLGEVTCDGSREVGLFWSAALDWELVWDQDEETAIQSPHGGTKVSWGGPPVTPATPDARQRFALVADDLGTEVRRLVDLGATELEDESGRALLVDPDGREFVVASG